MKITTNKTMEHVELFGPVPDDEPRHRPKLSYRKRMERLWGSPLPSEIEKEFARLLKEDEARGSNQQ